MILAGFEANTITTELKRILPNAVVRYCIREAAMLEGVVSRNQPLNGSMANPGRAPILRTKFVTKKEMNKCMAEIYDPGGIRTRAARVISQYHNH